MDKDVEKICMALASTIFVIGVIVTLIGVVGLVAFSVYGVTEFIQSI